MAGSRPVIVHAVLVGSDGTSDDSEMLDLHGWLGPDGQPGERDWHLVHLRSEQVVCDAPLARVGEDWVIGAGQDCDAPLRCVKLRLLRPGEYLSLGGHGAPAVTFRIVNVIAVDEQGAPAGPASTE